MLIINDFGDFDVFPIIEDFSVLTGAELDLFSIGIEAHRLRLFGVRGARRVPADEPGKG